MGKSKISNQSKFDSVLCLILGHLSAKLSQENHTLNIDDSYIENNV